MGLNTKQVSGDQAVDWGQTFLQSAAAETSKSASTKRQQQQPEALNCPRCASSNTKFCYYNNYNKSQPRHFCKSCKRHWTKGGTLRNVPVGGARKNKRPKLNSKPSAAAATAPATTAALRQQDFSTSSSSSKNMSNILYHAFIGRSSSPLLHDTSKGIDSIIASSGATTAAAAAAQTVIPNTEFNLSCLSSFDMNASLISYQPFDQFGGNLDHSIEESTITTVNIGGGSSGPWPGPESSSPLELPNYNWNWNDIDVLTSGDLSLTWDDDVDKAVIKP